MRDKKCRHIHHCPSCGGLLDCDAHIVVQGVLEAMRVLPRLHRAATEEVWVVWLDNNADSIRAERLAKGGHEKVSSSSHELVRLGCKAHANYAVVAHNHPGTKTAGRSSADDHAAGVGARALGAVGITQLDDLVVSRDGTWCSMYALRRAAMLERRAKRRRR